MPDTIDAVTGLVTSLLILDPEIEWLALESPLFFAIVAQHDTVITAGAIAIHGKQRRPVGGARAIADTLATTDGILVKGVQRHAVAAGEHSIGGHGRCCVSGQPFHVCFLELRFWLPERQQLINPAVWPDRQFLQRILQPGMRIQAI